MSAAGAYAIEPFLQGFSAPVGIHAYGGTSLLVSNWSGGTVERVQADGRRSVFLDNIVSPAGIATDATAPCSCHSILAISSCASGRTGSARRSRTASQPRPESPSHATAGCWSPIAHLVRSLLWTQKQATAPWWRVDSRCQSAWSR